MITLEMGVFYDLLLHVDVMGKHCRHGCITFQKLAKTSLH